MHCKKDIDKKYMIRYIMDRMIGDNSVSISGPFLHIANVPSLLKIHIYVKSL